MGDDLTCQVDWPCPSPASVSHLPLAKMFSSKHRVGGIWDEQGSQYSPGPLHVCAVQLLAAGLLSTSPASLSCLLVQKITQRATKQQTKKAFLTF